MSDIADFILARVAEDERAAVECAKLFPPPWEIADRGWRVRIYSAAVPLSEDVGDPGDERVPCVIEVEPTYAHDGWLSDNVEHIARHDPARVLAECEAKRRLVEAVSAWKHEVVEDCWYTCAAATEDHDGGECCDDNRWGTGCDCGLEFRVRSILGPLASIYADHPDCREEWK